MDTPRRDTGAAERNALKSPKDARWAARPGTRHPAIRGIAARLNSAPSTKGAPSPERAATNPPIAGPLRAASDAHSQKAPNARPRPSGVAESATVACSGGTTTPLAAPTAARATATSAREWPIPATPRQSAFAARPPSSDKRRPIAAAITLAWSSTSPMVRLKRPTTSPIPAKLNPMCARYRDRMGRTTCQEILTQNPAPPSARLGARPRDSVLIVPCRFRRPVTVSYGGRSPARGAGPRIANAKSVVEVCREAKGLCQPADSGTRVGHAARGRRGQRVPAPGPQYERRRVDHGRPTLGLPVCDGREHHHGERHQSEPEAEGHRHGAPAAAGEQLDRSRHGAGARRAGRVSVPLGPRVRSHRRSDRRFDHRDDPRPGLPADRLRPLHALRPDVAGTYDGVDGARGHA